MRRKLILVTWLGVWAASLFAAWWAWWRPPVPRRVLEGSHGWSLVGFSHDSRWVAAESPTYEEQWNNPIDGIRTRVWSTQTGELVHPSLSDLKLDTVFSGDNIMITPPVGWRSFWKFGTDAKGTFDLNPADGQLRSLMGGTTSTYRFVMGADHKYLVDNPEQGEGATKVCDVEAGRVVYELPAQLEALRVLADNVTLLGRDSERRELIWWNLPDRRQIASLTASDCKVALSAGDRFIAVAGDGRDDLVMTDEHGKVFSRVQLDIGTDKQIKSLCVSPSGRRVAIVAHRHGDVDWGQFLVCDTASGRVTSRVDTEAAEELRTAFAWPVRFLTDDTIFTFATNSRYLFDVSGDRPKLKWQFDPYETIQGDGQQDRAVASSSSSLGTPTFLPARRPKDAPAMTMNQASRGILEWNGDCSRDNRWFASGGTYEWNGGTALDWLTGQRSAEWLKPTSSELTIRDASSMRTCAVIPDIGSFEFAPDSRSLVTQVYGYGAITIYDLPLRHNWCWVAVVSAWLILLTTVTLRFASRRRRVAGRR